MRILCEMPSLYVEHILKLMLFLNVIFLFNLTL